MSKTSSNTETFVMQNCILSYPHLFQPQQVQGKGDPKYSAALLVDEATMRQVYGKAQELAQSHFKNNEFAMPNFQWPVFAAGGKPNYASNPRLASLFVVNAKASADYPPQVVDQNRQQVMDRGAIYAGCIVAAGVRLYTYNNMGNMGIGVGLSAIMKTGDGEALGGESVDPNALFSGVQVHASAVAGGMPQGMMPQGMPPMGAMPGNPPASMPGTPPPAPAAVPGMVQPAPFGQPTPGVSFPGGAPALAQPMPNFGQPATPATPGMPQPPFPQQ